MRCRHELVILRLGTSPGLATCTRKTGDGISRSAAIRQAVIHAAERRERAAQLRRAVLAMDLGEPDGIDVAAELARDRGDER